MGRGSNLLYGEFIAPKREASPLAQRFIPERVLDLSIIDSEGSAQGYTFITTSGSLAYVKNFTEQGYRLNINGRDSAPWLPLLLRDVVGEMLPFSVGDEVRIDPSTGLQIEGTITEINHNAAGGRRFIL